MDNSSLPHKKRRHDGSYKYFEMENFKELSEDDQQNWQSGKLCV